MEKGRGGLGEAVLSPRGTEQHTLLLFSAPQWEAWECGLEAWQKLALPLTSPSLMVKSSSLGKAVMKVVLKAELKSHFFCPLII